MPVISVNPWVPGGAMAVPDWIVPGEGGSPLGPPSPPIQPDMYAPLFDGQAVFGQPPNVFTAEFAPSPANVDSFLLLPPGTTTAGGNQRGYRVRGPLVGPSAASVAAQQAALQAATGIVGTLFRATGLRFPGDGEQDPNCYWLPTDLVFDAAGIVASSNGWWYTLAYRLVIRRLTNI